MVKCIQFERSHDLAKMVHRYFKDNKHLKLLRLDEITGLVFYKEIKQ